MYWPIRLFPWRDRNKSVPCSTVWIACSGFRLESCDDLRPHRGKVMFDANSVRLRRGFQLPISSAPMVAPSLMSVRRVRPRHMTVLLGGGSLARAR